MALPIQESMNVSKRSYEQTRQGNSACMTDIITDAIIPLYRDDNLEIYKQLDAPHRSATHEEKQPALRLSTWNSLRSEHPLLIHSFSSLGTPSTCPKQDTSLTHS